jgi:hypothetical protein
MTDQPFVDFEGRKAVRIRDLTKDKCLLLFHDKSKNIFRLGMFEVVGNDYRALAGEPRVVSDSDPLTEIAKKLAKEIGEEFRGSAAIVAAAATTPKPKKAATRGKNSAVKTIKIDE